MRFKYLLPQSGSGTKHEGELYQLSTNLAYMLLVMTPTQQFSIIIE